MAKKPIEIGEKAPDFRLTNQDGETIAKDDLTGQWTVLYFYPKDDTPGCTTEACEFTSQLKDFEDLNARVIGVSPDSSESHRQFIDKHNLAVELLSDPNKEALLNYKAWGEKIRNGKSSEGVLRSTVLIDPEGKVAYHWPNVKAEGHADEVRSKLKELAN